MSDFKAWFEANVYWKFPGDPYENSFTIMLRMMDAVAQYVDEKVGSETEQESRPAEADIQELLMALSKISCGDSCVESEGLLPMTRSEMMDTADTVLKKWEKAGWW